MLDASVIPVVPLAIDLGNFLQTALTVVTFASLAGLGLLRGTVTNLREQLTDERSANASMRQSREDDRAKMTQLEADVDALGRLKTGVEQIKALGGQIEGLGSKMEDHLGQARHHWERQEEIASHQADLSEKMLAAILEIPHVDPEIREALIRLAAKE